MKVGSDRTVLAAFFSSAVFAGGNAVAARFSNRELPPLWGAGLRFGLAAVLMLLLMAALRVTVPRGRALVGTIVFGLFNFGGAFAFAYYGLLRVQAGFGQTLLSVVPLLTIVLAIAHRQERPRLDAVVGGLVAVAGVALMTGASLGGEVPLLSVLSIIGGATCFAEAAVLVRRFPAVHPVARNAVGMTVGAAVLLLGSLAAGESMVLPGRAETWVALAYAVVMGSVVVFLLYVFVLDHWPASRAAYGFVLIPFVTVLLSAWLDDEPIGIGFLAGGALVLLGVYIGALRRGVAAH